MSETPIEVPIETFPIHKETDGIRIASLLQPYRIVMMLIGLALIASAVFFMRWDCCKTTATLSLRACGGRSGS